MRHTLHLQMVQEEVLGVEHLQEVFAGLLVHGINHLLQTWACHAIKGAVITWRWSNEQGWG